MDKIYWSTNVIILQILCDKFETQIDMLTYSKRINIITKIEHLDLTGFANLKYSSTYSEGLYYPVMFYSQSIITNL